MRLLYVADRFPVLSETFVVNEVRGLVRAGDDVMVYARRGGDPEVAPDLAELVVGYGAAPSGRGIGAALRLRERGALSALAEAAWLARHVEADHVHAHFTFGNATVALLYGHLTGAPASFTAHAFDLYGGVPATVIGRKVAGAAFAAAVSEHGAATLRACAAPADRGKVVVQRNGVAREALRAGEPELPPRIVAIARLVEKKGLDVLIEAARSLDPGIVVEIVGDGPERQRLEALSRAWGRRVRFTGALPHAYALRRLSGASAFALPCRQLASGDRDGLPVALVEAMSAGVPVVTTPIAGIPELVRNGETGLLVAPDDPAALAAALTRVVEDRPLRDRLAASGRAATEPWDIDRCIATLRARFSSGSRLRDVG
jgi:glycosyltransferase involved in cell wall biosynthesis